MIHIHIHIQIQSQKEKLKIDIVLAYRNMKFGSFGQCYQYPRRCSFFFRESRNLICNKIKEEIDPINYVLNFNICARILFFWESKECYLTLSCPQHCITMNDLTKNYATNKKWLVAVSYAPSNDLNIKNKIK